MDEIRNILPYTITIMGTLETESDEIKKMEQELLETNKEYLISHADEIFIEADKDELERIRKNDNNVKNRIITTNFDKKQSKEKILKLITDTEKKEKCNVNDFIGEFKRLFENQYIQEHYSQNQAYYQIDKNSYYLKNGLGIGIELCSGDWDRCGNNISHRGKDITIFSRFAKDEECRNGITIFAEDEYLENDLLKKIDIFFNIDLSMKSLIENKDENVYKVLPSEVKNNEDVVLARYKKLKEISEDQHKDEVEYETISPYRRN